ncbi:hypothetical protein SF23_02795 [Streptomyces sp. MBRL 10]|nr:hypothetical protein SF23_02795 [Streptomyces sp. MBRL 10]
MQMGSIRDSLAGQHQQVPGKRPETCGIRSMTTSAPRLRTSIRASASHVKRSPAPSTAAWT